MVDQQQQHCLGSRGKLSPGNSSSSRQLARGRLSLQQQQQQQQQVPARQHLDQQRNGGLQELAAAFN
jgi:hypothetical protein